MQFVSTDDYTFSWPVKVTRPDPQKPGEVVTQSFNGTFRLLDDVEAVRVAELHQNAKTGAAHLEASKANIRAILFGWDNSIVDAGGRAIAFSTEALEQLMRFGPFRVAVINAYAEAVSKGPAAGN